MGLGTVNDAKEILLIATGEKKAPIIADLRLKVAVPNQAAFAELVSESLTRSGSGADSIVAHRKQNPSMLMRYHPNTTVIVDKAADSMVEYYQIQAARR